MKVKDLKHLISNLPDDMEVVLQKDAEGNGYSPLEGGDAKAIYISESMWSGEVYSEQWTAEEACMDNKEWRELLKKPRALILFPVN